MLRWLGTADPAGLLYGAIVSAAVLAAVSLHDDRPVRVATSTGVVLVIYWMADVYVHALSARFDGDRRGMGARLVFAASHKAGVVRGGLPAIFAYLVVYALGAEPSTAAFSALGVSIVVLTAVGYAGARHAGAEGRAAVWEGAGAGALGVIIVVAKSLLH